MSLPDSNRVDLIGYYVEQGILSPRDAFVISSLISPRTAGTMRLQMPSCGNCGAEATLEELCGRLICGECYDEAASLRRRI